MNRTSTHRDAERWRASLPRRVAVCFYGLSFGMALPLAVFTTNGLLGLIVHGIALSGFTSLFERSPSAVHRQVPGGSR